VFGIVLPYDLYSTHWQLVDLALAQDEVDSTKSKDLVDLVDLTQQSISNFLGKYGNGIFFFKDISKLRCLEGFLENVKFYDAIYTTFLNLLFIIA
jgi:hypothetical protein